VAILARAADAHADAHAEPPRLIIEEVSADSPRARAGLMAGDKLLTYNDRLLLSFLALQAAQQNIFGKRGAVLRVRQGVETLTLTVPPDKLGVVVRREFPPTALALYKESVAAEQAQRTGDAISRKIMAAKAALEAEDKAVAGWLYLLVGVDYETQKKWKEAQEMYLAGWKLLEGSHAAAVQSQMLEALGRCSQSLNDYPAAQQLYENALRMIMAAGNEMSASSDCSSSL
jgi:tetratricopeptide (TPR) repeat protein